MVSKDPRSGADCERSECSTDLRTRHPPDHYQTDTAGKHWRKKDVFKQCFHIKTNQVQTEMEEESVCVRLCV